MSLQLIYCNLSYLDGFDGQILRIFLKIVTDACRWMISLFSRKSRARGGGGGEGRERALTNSDPRACATDQIIFPSSKGYQINNSIFQFTKYFKIQWKFHLSQIISSNQKIFQKPQLSRNLKNKYFSISHLVYTFPVNQPNKTDESHSFLPTTDLAYKTVIYF